MMKIKMQYIICLNILLIISFAQNNTMCQTNYIRNGSLAGVIGQSNIPTDWSVCDSYSSPDIFAEYIGVNSNGAEYTIYPVKDSSFVFLRTRAKYHPDPPGPYTYEYITQRLAKPLEKNSTFIFDFFYCFNKKDYYHNFTDYPVRLELWVGNDSCAHDKMLMQTEALQDTFWMERHCTFSLSDTSYAYIRVTTQWDSMTMSLTHESYNGMILLDNLSIYKIPNGLDTIKTYDVYYKGDGKNTLQATLGTSYSWMPQINLSAYNIQSPVINGYTKQYSVAVGSLTTCSHIEAFNIILNCDTIYPQKNIDSFQLYFNPHKKIILNASNGKKYIWNPDTHLSNDTICCPYLTDYDSLINVTVWDKYNCPYNEKFKILLNCDTIVPNKNITTLDTLVTKQTSIQLIPSFGELDGDWNPTTWLSCSKCREPISTPSNSITYTAILRDEYGCTHQEAFKIAIELDVPNVITPNGDGFNDCFKINGLPDNTSVKIYTKNGVLVYSAKPYTDSNCWKGIDNSGKLLESNTYWFVLENPEKGLFIKGFVFLMR